MNEPITVLLIDDQTIIAEAVQQMLASEPDISFHYCNNPLQTLKVVQTCRPTVILQDLVMPQIEGLLLVRLLRSSDAPTHQIPLIVLSSKEDPVIKAQAFEYGANDYLVKLPDRVELLARIRYHSRAYTNLLKREEAEALLRQENEEQALYIEQVNKITDAAFAVEQNQFEAKQLDEVVDRQDELGQLARVFTQMVKTVKVREAELERLKDSLARFFPEEYLQFLRKDSVIDVQLGDFVSKTMAVMFSDIRSFTTISENMSPRENFDFINAYLKRVSPEIRNHYGIIVKFLGDGMMAVFPDGADDAIAAGIAKHQRVWEYNQQRLARGDRPIRIGIGIHVGHMMLGMVGESNRIQGDAFSDNVNLTSRLEGLTKVYGSALLITGQTLEQLSNPEAYDVRFLANTIVKGRTEPISVYEILNAEVEAMRTLKLRTLPQFQQGIAYYQDRALTEAKTCFEQVLSIHPDDRMAQLYCDRVDALLSQGIPEDWQNVGSFESF
ncbi:MULTISPECIES: response regulator [Leptolyngbya]|uniref:Adenylate/guanylate cyclase domain-containing protein n=1 Tax=Leptolyngbya boryana CZ1 TaxID=3060204 RepID=A0AA96X7Y8_LEPBY|nr:MULTISPECIES: adenylate/guanylate cyclase domain-containing protein [Leptolyngbya]MCY6490153.1 response regulator [Leptolyngbya sp. GGD]WNZ47210.1 adenylate/guanylate cyclase domain-containing protein [Leptolyngbya boryana CZ1]